MLGKNYWADSECALNAVATAAILTFDHVSPPVSPFISFSLLSLRHGVVVVCFKVIKGESSCHSACAMWSRGSWLGILGFRMVLCCFSYLCVWPCVFVFRFFFVCFLAVLAILGCDDTMLPSPAWIHQWTGCQSFLCVRFWLVCFCCLVLCFVWFCLCVFAVYLVYDDDGPMDYVQVLPQFSFAALNSRWPGTLIGITAHAMSYSEVNDLAKAMKALDGKNVILQACIKQISFNFTTFYP